MLEYDNQAGGHACNACNLGVVIRGPARGQGGIVDEWWLGRVDEVVLSYCDWFCWLITACVVYLCGIARWVYVV